MIYRSTRGSRLKVRAPEQVCVEQFVDALNANAGGALSQAERDQLVSELTSGAKTRAQVLRSAAETSTLAQQELNKAFVLMQYFGYLRRNPNDAPDTNYAGFDFWLAKMNQFSVPGEDVRNEQIALGRVQRAEMVRAFILSGEYRSRFGQP